MNRRTVLVIGVAATVLAGAAVLRRLQLQRAEAVTDYQTVAARRGTIVATVNSSGSVLAEDEVALLFPSPGILAETKVQTGDKVESDQELARLDTRQLEWSVVQAEAALKSAEAQLAQIRTGPSSADSGAAKAGVESAQASLDRLLSGPTANDLASARLNVDAAKNQLWSAQAQRDSVKGNPLSSQAAIDSAEAQVLLSELNVQQAILAQEKLNEQPSDADVALARSQLAQAKAQLDKLQRSPTMEELAIAEAQVEQARAALEQAKLRLADAILVAPFPGTVVSVGASAGEFVAAGIPVIVLADLERYYVDARVDETDIGRVQVGQDAAIVLDAFPDNSLGGKVTRIDPLGAVAQGVVSYAVRIEVRSSDIALRPNMTAIADIVVERKEGVLLVPNRAIRRDSTGRFYVEVVSNGEVQRRSVTTGLNSELMTEVLTGLSEGEEVVVSAPRRNVLEEVGGPFGFGGQR
jgi:HlyD family secretion protein